MNVLIVGAADNLGSFLVKHLLPSPHRLRLLTHQRSLPFELPPNAADTRRKKGEIAPCLIYPSLTEGLADL